MVDYLLEREAMVVTSTEQELAQEWLNLSNNPVRRDQLGTAAKQAVDNLPDRVQFYRDKINSLII